MSQTQPAIYSPVNRIGPSSSGLTRLTIDESPQGTKRNFPLHPPSGHPVAEDYHYLPQLSQRFNSYSPTLQSI